MVNFHGGFWEDGSLWSHSLHRVGGASPRAWRGGQAEGLLPSHPGIHPHTAGGQAGHPGRRGDGPWFGVHGRLGASADFEVDVKSHVRIPADAGPTAERSRGRVGVQSTCRRGWKSPQEAAGD